MSEMLTQNINLFENEGKQVFPNKEADKFEDLKNFLKARL